MSAEDKYLLSHFQKALNHPQIFAETFLNVVEGDELKPFRALHPQKLIYNSNKLVTYICNHRRSGKAQPLNSVVYTPDGPVKMGDVQVGQIVCTPAGGQSIVTSIIPQGIRKVYKVTLDDGTTVEAADNHEWEVYTGLYWRGTAGKSRKIYGNKVLTTEEIFKDFLWEYGNNRREFRYKINPIKEVKFTKKTLPVEPYLLGVLLGDGHLKSLSICSNDVEIIKRAIPDHLLGRVTQKVNSSAKDYFIRDPELRQKLAEIGLQGCLSVDKFVPKVYLHSDSIDRLEILRGLMDTDGSVDKRGNGRAEFCSISSSLAENVAYLARSLGCKATVHRNSAGYSKEGVRVKTRDRFRVNIRFPAGLDLFHLERKKTPGIEYRYLRRSIVNVEYIGEELVQCIEITDPAHLYLTDNFTPTHNCSSGDTLVVHPVTLKPTPIRDLEFTTGTWCFDFRENKTMVAPCVWERRGVKPITKLVFGSGRNLKVTPDHLLFDWKRGWVEAGSLRVGDRVLAVSEIPVFGHFEPTSEELEKIINDTIFSDVDDRVYQFNRESLKKYLHGVWSKVGKVFQANSLVSFILQERELALILQHLLLRIGVNSKVDKEGDLFIYDPIDISVFLSAIGFEYQVLDVHAPRRWEIVTETSKRGEEEVYDLVVDHQDRNFIANDFVVHNSFALATLAIFHAITTSNCQVKVFVPGSDQLNMIFGDIDKFVFNSEFVMSMKVPKGAAGWTKDPQVRTFTNGSTITGHLLGIDANLSRGRRGLGADICIVDEAQDLEEEHWRVVAPIISGDKHRFGKVKAYISGTIVLPPRPFYRKIINYVQKGWKHDHEEIIYLPVDKNPEITAQMITQYRADCPSDDIWSTEWLLRPGVINQGVFNSEDIAFAGSHDYEYGPHLIIPNNMRFIAVDWDTVDCGTNIVICQYHPEIGGQGDTYAIGRTIKVIYREEVPKGPFGLLEATKRILTLADEYSPQLILADAGMGEGQIQWLQFETGRAQLLNLQGRVIRVAFGANVPTIDPETGELMKPAPKMKEHLIGLLKRVANERRLMFAAKDTLMAEQLLSYKEISRTESHVRYTKENEHLIDCLAMCVYGLTLLLGSEVDIMPMHEKTKMAYVPEQIPDLWGTEQHEVLSNIVAIPRGQIDENVFTIRRDFDSFKGPNSFDQF